MTQKSKIFKMLLFPLCVMLAYISIFTPCFQANAWTSSVNPTNNDFSTTTGDGFATIPSNWTPAVTGDHEEVLRGVVNAAEDASWTDFYAEHSISNPLLHSEATGDTRVLMISSTVPSRFGFKSTNSSTLSANNYYILTVLAKTVGGAVATLGLSGSFDTELKIENTANEAKPEDNDWVKYTLLIETNAKSSSSVNIQLWLGSRIDETDTTGTVFFDKVTLTRVDRHTFDNTKDAADVTKQVFSERHYVDDAISNKSFEEDLVAGEIPYWEKTESDNQVITIENFNIKDEDDLPTFGEKVLKISNTNHHDPDNDESEFFAGVTSDDIMIEQYGLYRISVFAKAITTIASIKLKLFATTANVTQTSTLSASTTQNTWNNWIEYIFYVRGSYIENSTVKLQILVGEQIVDDDDETPDTYESTAIFDGVTIERVTQAVFTSGTYRIDLSGAGTGKGISNGFFNFALGIVDFDGKPIEALDWTSFGDEATKGIVSLSNAGVNRLIFNDFKASVGNVTHPGALVSAKNIYAIHSATAVYSGIESKTTSISNKFSCVTVWVNTSSGFATIQLLNGNHILGEFSNITTSGEWKEYIFYIKPNSKIDVTLKLSLGAENETASGTVFFGNITYVAATESIFNQYASKTLAELEALNVSVFNHTSLFPHSSIIKNGLFTPITHTTTTDSDLNHAGVLVLDEINEGSPFFAYKNDITVSTDSTSDELLAIINTIQGTSKIEQNTGTTNTKSGYVKLSVKVKLLDVVGQAYVKFGNLGTVFLDEGTEADEDGWIECSIIVKTGSNIIGTLNVTFGLGYENERASGIALFDTTTSSLVDDKIYSKALESSSTTTLTVDISNETPVAASKKAKFSGNTTAIFFIVISSVILVGAILFAIISAGVKKLPKRVSVDIPASKIKPKKTKGNSKEAPGKGKGFV